MNRLKQTNLSCYDFGRELLKLGDLDPVYVVLHKADLNPRTLERWLVAYWCFYHVGTSSWVADNPLNYWTRMRTAAGSKNYPRSPERRHFRGGAALRSVAYLSGRGLWRLFDDLYGSGPTAAELVVAAKRWVGFGPWVSFKIADMVERLGLRPVEFDLDTVLYDSPRKAADELWKEERGCPPPDGSAGAWAVGRVLGELNPYPAPPRGDRNLGPQEAETVLCKWGSYRGGHYEPGEDVASCRKGLERFNGCRTAQRLLGAGKEVRLWS